MFVKSRIPSVICYCTCLLSVIIAGASGSVGQQESRDILTDRVAFGLVGGATEEVEDACCVFEPDCDLDESLCSSNSSLLCKAGGTTAYRLVSVSNRDNCQTTPATNGKTCTRDLSYVDCAYQIDCGWDEELDKCISASETPVMVPETCTDDCP